MTHYTRSEHFQRRTATDWLYLSAWVNGCLTHFLRRAGPILNALPARTDLLLLLLRAYVKRAAGKDGFCRRTNFQSRLRLNLDLSDRSNWRKSLCQQNPSNVAAVFLILLPRDSARIQP
jgi:hypothetical protein